MEEKGIGNLNTYTNIEIRVNRPMFCKRTISKSETVSHHLVLLDDTFEFQMIKFSNK